MFLRAFVYVARIHTKRFCLRAIGNSRTDCTATPNRRAAQVSQYRLDLNRSTAPEAANFYCETGYGHEQSFGGFARIVDNVRRPSLKALVRAKIQSELTVLSAG